MAEDLLKYENFEGLFDQFRPPPPNLLERASTATYQQVKTTLLLPNISNWRAYVVSLAIFSTALNILLYHRRYTHLARQTTRPKPLRNVITKQAFTKTLSRQRAALRFACFRALYRLAVQILLVTTGLLPWLWTGIEQFRQREGIWNAANAFETQFGHTVNTLAFYLCCALLWTVCMLPVLYGESYVLDLGARRAGDGGGDGDGKGRDERRSKGEGVIKDQGENHGKPALRAWLLGIARDQGVMFLKAWFFLYNAEGDMLLYGVEATLKTSFYMMMAHPLALALGFLVLAVWPVRGVVPLPEGNTKRGLEKMARDLGVRLAGLYYSTEVRGKADGGHDVKIYGLPWKRSVVISDRILEKCDPDEVVALTAFELGSLKHDPFLGLIIDLAYHWSRSLCYLVLMFNWRNVCESFGFGTEFSYSSQHPFQAVILMIGGAIEPISNAIHSLARASGDKFEYDGDKVASQKGYGGHLAKAIIKFEKDDLEAVNLEDVYSHAWSNTQNLGKRLERLQWTGEEKMPEEEKQHYHWEL